MKSPLSRALIAIAIFAAHLASAQPSAFTYQGRLQDRGNPANGAYDIAFSLYDQDVGGGSLGPSLTNYAVGVSNGLFAVALDFGATNFSGADLWLDIVVRTNGSPDFAVLNPRQKITSSPYAVTAMNLSGSIASDKIAGAYTNPVSFSNPGNSLAGDGSALTGLNAGNLSSGIVPVVRGGTGAALTAQARANLGAAARGVNSDITGLSALTTPLTVAQGGSGAQTAAGALANLGAASLTASNTFAGVNFLSNAANLFSGTFIGDGSGLTGLSGANLTNGMVSVADGGTGAGTPADARASLGAAASGSNSDITVLSGLATPLSIAQGGSGAQTAAGALSNFGGASLSASNTFAGVNVLSNGANLFSGAFVGDGSGLTGLNLVGDGSRLTNLNAASLAGGVLPNAQLAGTYSATLTFGNPSNSFFGAFAGNGSGLTNVNAATLGGLTAASFWQLGGNTGTSPGPNFLGTTDGHALELKTTGGVAINTNNPGGKALSVNGGIGITSANTLEFGSDVPGKQQNAGKIGYQTLTAGSLDIIGAGTNSTSRAIKFWAEAGATFNGTGTNPVLTVVNTVDETTSLTFAAPYTTWQVGQNKPPDNRNAFDSFFVYQLTAATSRLLITSDGRVGLNTNNPIYPLHMGNGAYCTAGGQWTSVSDRNAKEAFTAVQPREILEKVAALPITEWRYKAETNGARHLGPMAQDFHAAFGLGESDRAIGTLDANGVTLAAIQGLNQLVAEKEARIHELEARTQALEERLKALEVRR